MASQEKVLTSFAELGLIAEGVVKRKAPKKPVVRLVTSAGNTPANLVEEDATYKTISRYTGVVIPVPKKSGFMTYKPASTTNSGVAVSEHWHNGVPLGGKIFLNRFFYNITKKNIGRRIVAVVDVIEKTISDGTVYKMLNIIHTPDARDACQYEFKMPQDGDEGTLINECLPHRIYFKSRKHNRLTSS